MKSRVIASCFFEASTRTRLSFEAAVQRLGGSLIGFSDGRNTSMAQKGESLQDSIRIITGYADALIMRHPYDGAARLAAEVSNVPVINGGDGANQHPTQTLLDLFTIAECQGRLQGLNVAFVGDLKYGRTVHSLAQALALFQCNLHFIAPSSLQLPDYLLQRLPNSQCDERIESVLDHVDILYMTRLQRERFDPTEYAHITSQYVLKASMLTQVKSNLRILHPLPRVDEIDTSVDYTPYAYYFQQAENGLYARQALLALMLNPQGIAPESIGA